MSTVTLHHGDCLAVMPTLPEVDAIVCDPPYALSFMSKKWDAALPSTEVWRECLRVLKPGGYMLAFGGTRTHHRLMCSIEDAGFEIRDVIMWVHGQGFPKGKGCLKPAWEPVVWAQKPLNQQGDFDIIMAETTSLIEALLCQITPATVAARLFAASGDGGSVPLLASMCTAARQSPARSELTVMFSSPETALITLSIALLWDGILGVLCGSPSTSTTATESSLTIALRTLNSLISASTLGHITPGEIPGGGQRSNARSARGHTRGPDHGSSVTPSPSAPGPATWPIADAVANGLASIAGRLLEDSRASIGSSARGDVTPITGRPTVDLILSRIDEHLASPAWEPIVLARKPGAKVLPLGVEECRVDAGGDRLGGGAEKRDLGMDGWDRPWRHDPDAQAKHAERIRANIEHAESAGRWPPNLCLSHHELCNGTCHPDCVVRALGEQSGERKSGSGQKSLRKKPHSGAVYTLASGKLSDALKPMPGLCTGGDTGTAARFYPQFKYEPKASRRDRNEGCEGMEAKVGGMQGNGAIADTKRGKTPDPGEAIHGAHGKSTRIGVGVVRQNHHPTVKPTALMEWLVRLACPEGGTVLDPFMGSGSTGKACMRSGRNFIGIELDAQWLPIAEARIEAERTRHPLFAGIE